MDTHQINRRRFGWLAMGGSTWALTACNTPLSAQASRLPPGVQPAAARHAYADGLPRSMPEAEGVSSEAVLAFLRDVADAGYELHSFMLSRNNKVVAEGWWWPYQPDRLHITHSLTKSITAVAVGLAIDEGRFGLDDKLVSFFPEYVPAGASENLRAITVRNLLTMQCGHDKETSGSVWRPLSTPWAAEFFKIPVPHAPGTHFQYTSAASFMLSALISKTTGTPMADYLKPRFFAPLGIDRWEWDTSPGNVSPGGNGLSWNTAASLKLGALHSSGGLWNGQRILSEQWVQAATTDQTQGLAEDGYGYQWWMGPADTGLGGTGKIRPYFALGLFGQFSIVFPEHNAVLAVFAALSASKLLRPLIWKHFPAAFLAPAPPGPATEALRVHTAALRLLPPLTPASSPVSARISGRRFAVQPNDQGVEHLSFDFTPEACTYRMRDDHGDHGVTAGFTQYLEQDTSMTGNRLHHEYRPPRQRVVAGARWTAPDTLEMVWQFVETAFRDTLVCKFTDAGVAVTRSVNINSAETRLPTLQGRLT